MKKLNKAEIIALANKIHFDITNDAVMKSKLVSEAKTLLKKEVQKHKKTYETFLKKEAKVFDKYGIRYSIGSIVKDICVTTEKFVLTTSSYKRMYLINKKKSIIIEPLAKEHLYDATYLYIFDKNYCKDTDEFNLEFLQEIKDQIVLAQIESKDLKSIVDTVKSNLKRYKN